VNKLVAVLAIVIILLSSVCGILYYQIDDLQSQNSERQNQIGQLENQTDELESQLAELELENLELQNQTGELEAALNALENATVMVKITGFEIAGATLSPDGQGYYSSAEVTLQNFGITDVEGLVLWVNYTAPIEIGPDNIDYYMKRVQLGLVHAGETRNATVDVVWWAAYGKKFVASLMLDDIVLDESVYSTSR
jgi:type II secretory pathway pseudopilin PulG